jgi:hypothetical protein
MTTIDLATTIEALHIVEEKTRKVRQGLEAQLREERSNTELLRRTAPPLG